MPNIWVESGDRTVAAQTPRELKSWVFTLPDTDSTARPKRAFLRTYQAMQMEMHATKRSRLQEDMNTFIYSNPKTDHQGVL